MKQSRKAKEIEARKAADPIARLLERTDIDYTTDELPTAPRAYVVTPTGTEALVARPKAQESSRERVIKFRTPTRCQNGHFRWYFFEPTFGSARGQWGDSPCKCATHEFNEGFDSIGPDQQFSGLLDSKGNQIFEGDRVYLAGYGEYTVEFPFTQLYEAAAENDIGEIVGNIYE